MSRRQMMGVTAAVAAGSATFLAAGTGRAAAAPSRANYAYTIARPHEQFLTLERPGGPAVVLPPRSEPGSKDWELEPLQGGVVYLRNMRAGAYLGYEGEPRVNKLVLGRAEPVAWELRVGDEEDTSYLVAPGGPVDGHELALDLSLLLVYPPRTALRPLESGRAKQGWLFTVQG